MKKNKLRVIVSFSVVILIIIIFSVLKSVDPIWEANAKRFSSSLNIINGKPATIDNLSDFTTFEWDTLYSFAPYTPEETIYEVIGYRWENISSTVSEGMNQIVFIKDSKVVCYIDGYPYKYKVFFDFGHYNDSNFKLTSSDKLTFTMTLTDDGIRILDYQE